jgi:hypothetical protein
MTAQLPQQPYTEPVRPQWQQPKRGFWRSTNGLFVLIFGGILLLTAVLVPLLMAYDRATDSVDSPLTVKVDRCELSDGDIAQVTFSVTNTSSRAQSAAVDIEYRDRSGARVDTDTAYTGNIPAGDTIRKTEQTFLDADATGGTCRILRVR